MNEATQTKKSKNFKKTLIIIIIIFLSLSLVLTSAYFYLYYSGKAKFHKGDINISLPTDVETEDIEIDENEVTYKDKTYCLNENIVSVLCMGIDKESINKDMGYGKNGQADSIFVAAIDTKLKKITIIPISRETLVDVNEYSINGEFLGVNKEPVCLAFAYGNSAESSAKNVARSVSRILYGINISSYIAVDLDGISAITTKIGGIAIPALEDVKIGGKTVKQGTQVTLKGKSAVEYIRQRGSDLEANNRRMARQKQFLNALISSLGNSVLSDFSNLTGYYNALKPYTATDLDFSQITYLVSSCLSKDIGSSIVYMTPTGSVAMGEKWVEFTPNPDNMLQIIMSVFYTEK